MITYQTYSLLVRFEDGTIKGFLSTPIIAISIVSALADMAFEAYPEGAEEMNNEVHSECDRAHWRRMLKRQLKGLGYVLTEYVNSVEWLQDEIIRLGAEPFKPCFERNLNGVCMLPANGHTEHKMSKDCERESAAFILGSKGGQSTSPSKIEAARTNGKKGGRKKRQDIEVDEL